MERAESSIYELWFRYVYKTLIKDKAIHVALRPNDRRYPMPKGTRAGELAVIKIIKTPGDEESGIKPVFSEFEQKIKITKIVVKKLGDLKQKELRTCSPDCRDKKMAKYHLGLIYNREFGNDDLVSLVYFDYM